jgi:hypothetical protein
MAGSEDAATGPVVDDRLVHSKSVGIPERVIMAALGLVLLGVPWKLLIAPDAPSTSPKLWLLAVSLGAVTLAIVLLIGGVTGPKFVTVIDFARGTVERSMRGAFGFDRTRTATLDDIDRIEISRLHVDSANSSSWLVVLKLRPGSGSKALEIASFGTPERAEAFAGEIRARIARSVAATVDGAAIPPSGAAGVG